MSDPRALGDIVRTLRLRARFEPRYCAQVVWPTWAEATALALYAALEDHRAWPVAERLAPLVDRLLRHGAPTPAERDALYAAAKITPPDVLAVATDPAEWDAIRDLRRRRAALAENDAALAAMAAKARPEGSEGQ